VPDPEVTPATTITPAILDTILGHLAPHFIACAANDLPTARHAASRTLASYDVETEEELRLAAEIVSFGFHALETLSEAAAPDLSLNQKLRLRGSAVSLSREAHKSQRKLDQLQRARRTGSPRPKTEQPTPDIPEGADQALGLIEFAREALAAGATKGGPQTWTPSRQQRRAAERAVEKFRRNKAEHDRRQAMKQAATTPAPAENILQSGAA
jgi:hypothetical protein